MKILYLHKFEYTSNLAHLVHVKAMCKAISKMRNEIILSLQSNEKTAIPDKDNYPYHIHFRKSVVENKKIDKYINLIIFGRQASYFPIFLALTTSYLLYNLKPQKKYHVTVGSLIVLIFAISYTYLSVN